MMIDATRASREVRYRLDVIAASIVDVVICAGGWLFDRSMAGWEVTVLVTEPGDDRPLRIVGARVGDLPSALEGMHPSPSALGVATEMYTGDERVRNILSKVSAGGGIGSPALGSSRVTGTQPSDRRVLSRIQFGCRLFQSESNGRRGSCGRIGRSLRKFSHLQSARWMDAELMFAR
jgi:hypothetical protein